MSHDFSAAEESDSPFDFVDDHPDSRYGTSPTLGDIRQILRADKNNLIAGVVLGLLSFTAAIVLLVVSYRLIFTIEPMVDSFQNRVIYAVISAALAVGCVAGGMLFVRQSLNHWGLVVTIGDLGFAWKSAIGKDDEYRWDDLIAIHLVESKKVEFREVLGHSRGERKSIELFGGLVTQQSQTKKERTYELVFRPDRRVRLDRNLMAGHDVLGDLAMIEGERRGIAPSNLELDEQGYLRNSAKS